jgi:hypothetical protein
VKCAIAHQVRIGLLICPKYALPLRPANLRKIALNSANFTMRDQAKNQMVGRPRSVRSQRPRKNIDPIWQKLVAGTGFEPVTFRL